MGLLDGFFSLGDKTNKAEGRGTTDDSTIGVVGDFLPELTLDMKDDDLIELFDKRERKWNESAIKQDWTKQSDDNENYWKGKQFSKIETQVGRPLVDNIVFQSVETYLPAATKQNPEPLVELRATEEQTDANLKYAEILRNRLSDWSDDVRLRLKLKKAGRHWLLSLMGVAKMGWDITNDRPAIKIVRGKKLILDPDGVTDEDGYSGEYIGEYRKLSASKIIDIIGGGKIGEVTDPELMTPEQKAIEKIKEISKGDLGTMIQFKEWWTPEYMCWILDDKVLLKKKNPHWNYEEEVAAENPVDAAATPSDPNLPPTPSVAVTPPPPTKPNNHFSSKRMPYVFIVIFNLGKSPVDETSLITQILPQQDLINKRNKQIDKNADSMNGGMVVSGERSGLTKDEASSVTKALQSGGIVYIPSGAPNDAVTRIQGVGLPADVFNNLNDTRNRVYDLFGIKGITPGGIKNEDTVRGKLITRGLDTDRIGGGITEYFEQFADEIYNWVVQLYYVYDDLFQQYKTATVPKVKISVKEGSLLPKDATTKANQAIELAGAGKMSLIDLYKALEYPNPEEMAARVWLEARMPELLFKGDPLVQEALQIMSQNSKNQAKPPSESISFKDVPPEAGAQMLAQAGIDVHPAAIAQHNAEQKKQKEQDKLPAIPK